MPVEPSCSSPYRLPVGTEATETHPAPFSLSTWENTSSRIAARQLGSGRGGSGPSMTVPFCVVRVYMLPIQIGVILCLFHEVYMRII